MIETYLEDLENRIDPSAEDDLERQWLDFLEGRFQGDLFSPKRLAAAAPKVAWPAVRVNEALDDFDRMALQQHAMCSQALAAGDWQRLCVRANYGSSILASLFGVELFIMPDESNTLPTSWPVKGGPDAIKALVDRGVPDPSAGLGARTLEMGERFVEIGRRYPRIGKYVSVYHPDVQGAMDACEVLWGSALFIDILSMPDLVHALLDLIAETYVRFMREWDRIVPSPSPDHAVHWSLMHKGHIMLRDDSAMNLSPAMFAEFVRPYDQRLLDDLGGGAVHFCGRGDHWVPLAAEMRNLHAITLSQPHLNDMEAIYRQTIDKGIPLLGLPRWAAEEALRRGRPLRGRVHPG